MRLGKRYCAIFYVGPFKSPHFGPISVQFLYLYAAIPAFYSKLLFRHLPPYVVARAVQKWGGCMGSKELFIDLRTELFWWDI